MLRRNTGLMLAIALALCLISGALPARAQDANAAALPPRSGESAPTGDEPPEPITWDAFDQAFYRHFQGGEGRISTFAQMPAAFFSNGRWVRGYAEEGIFMRFVTTSPGPEGLVLDAMIYADPRMNERAGEFLLSLLSPMYTALASLEGTTGELFLALLCGNPGSVEVPLNTSKPHWQHNGYALSVGSYDEDAFLVAHAAYTGAVADPAITAEAPRPLWETIAEPMPLHRFIERVSPLLALYDSAPNGDPSLSRDEQGRPVYSYKLKNTLTMHVTLRDDAPDAPLAGITGTDDDNTGPFMYSVALCSLHVLCDMDVSSFLAVNALGGYESIFEVLSGLRPYVIHKGVAVQFHSGEDRWCAQVYGAAVPGRPD